MNKKLRMMLIFCMSSIVRCETKYFYHKYDVNRAVEYLQGYTGMPMHDVLFFSSPWFPEDQHTFVEEIKLSPANQSIDRYTLIRDNL